MTIKTLASNQVVVEVNEKEAQLHSYACHVCDVVANCGMGFSKLVRLGRDWNYSKTTSKYVYKFIKEYTGITCNKSVLEKAIERGYFVNSPDVAIMLDKTMY